MYGTCFVHLKNLTEEQNKTLQTLSQMAASIYNLSLGVVKKQYAQNGAIPSLDFITEQIQDTPQFKASNGRLYQATLQATSDYQTYISTKRSIEGKAKQTIQAKGLDHLKEPKNKNGVMSIKLTKQAILGAMLSVPATNVTPALTLTLPADYGELDIVTVLLRPACSFKVWEAILTYSIRIKETTPTNKAMGIDLGLANFATCATTEGDSFILDGRYLKSLVQGYDKYSKRLKPRKGQYSKRYASLQRKSRNRIRDYVSQCAASVVKYCQQHDITTICLGWGIQFWFGFIGKTTKLFHYMPYKAFSKALAHQCRKNGVFVKWVDESFTSQASFLDKDTMPEHITRTEQHFSGKRRYRGLYVSSNKTKINADVNGALNILKKVMQFLTSKSPAYAVVASHSQSGLTRLKCKRSVSLPASSGAGSFIFLNMKDGNIMNQKDRYRKILKCLNDDFPIREGELDYYDDIIGSFMGTLDCADIAKAVLHRSIEELKSRLITEVTLSGALTPLAACYAERLQQLRVTLHDLNGTEAIEDLALLCFAMSYDLKWIEDKADEAELKEELAERGSPADTESHYKPAKPPIPEIEYDDSDDDLPF